MLLTRITIVASLINLSFSVLADSTLKDYYLGKVDLGEEQLLQRIDQTLESKTSDHLTSYAFYLKAIRFRQDQEDFKAYDSYDLALKYLSKADTIDPFLNSAILINQGVILKQYGLVLDAIKKQEQAIPFAYQYSKKYGILSKFNLGRALIHDQEKALSVFFEVLDEALLEKLSNRQAKVYNEIGLMFTRSEEYSDAVNYFKKGLTLAETDQVKADIIHNLSSVFFYTREYPKQEELLLQSLDLQSHVRRFGILRDLGENLLKQNKIEEARLVLLKAQKLYRKQPLRKSNIQIFEWLIIATKDSITYAVEGMREYRKLSEEQENFEALLKKQAMRNLVDKLAAKRENEEKIAFYSKWTAIGFLVTIFIYGSWHYKRRRIRKSIEKNLQDLKIVQDTKK